MPLIEGENNRGTPTVDIIQHLLAEQQGKFTPSNTARQPKPINTQGLRGRRVMNYDNSYCSDDNHGWISLEPRKCACNCSTIH